MPTDEMLPQTETTPLISFVITTYNLPDALLRACLDSVMALPLSGAEREIVLVDDGSDKSPMSALQDYTDRVLYIRKQNGGQSTARNMGIHCCHGTYIQFIDGDDMLISDVYSQCIELIRRESPDMVLWRYSDKPENDVAVSFEGPQEGAEYMRHYNLRVGPGGYVFRKSLLIDLRFREGIIMEDEEFTPLLFLRVERLFFTDAKAYYYRKREGSTMHKRNAEWIKKRLDNTLTVLLNLQEKADRMPYADREALQRRIDQLTMDYVYNIMTLTGDQQCLEERINVLHKHGLFPLPDRDYTTKYKWFRRMTKTSAGRKFVMRILKGKREK